MKPKEYFDEDFYKCKSKEKGGMRATLYVSNREYGLRLGRMMRDIETNGWRLLDIGGGTGHRSAYYGATTRCEAYNADISEWARGNSVLGERQICVSILDLDPTVHGTFEIVNCERVVSYLPVSDARDAIGRAVAVCTKYFIFADITHDHLDQELPARALISRDELAWKGDYLKVFKELPLKLDTVKTAIMRETGWDGGWVFKKVEVEKEKEYE